MIRDIKICRNQASGLSGFAEIIMDKAIELNGEEFTGYEYDNQFYQIYFDAKQIKEFLDARLQKK